MNELTVIVTARYGAAELRKTLDALCDQSTEAFDVLIVLRGEDPDEAAAAREFCDEYVGFRLLQAGECTVAAARNLGASNAGTPLILFMEGGDYLSPDSVEAFLETAKKTNADILAPRLYISGENEPYYEPWCELLAPAGGVDRFDTALLHTLHVPGRVYRKKFFDLYSLRFQEAGPYSIAFFTAEAVFRCDAKTEGCVGAVFEDGAGVFRRGFAENAAPGSETLERCGRFCDGLLSTVKTLLEEESGRFDGDEYTFQEAVSYCFELLTEDLYRRFWYLTDGDVAALAARYDALSALMTKDRREKLPKLYPDLRFPSMYMKRQDAAALPMVSLILDPRDPAPLNAFLASLYNGRFPFFEIFLPQRFRDRADAFWLGQENLHVLPDAGFFAAARNAAAGVQISVKDLTPLDPKLLPGLAVVRAPHSFYQYIFALRRKKTGAKTALKKKGANIR